MSALESTRDRPASLMTKPDSPMKPATPNPLKVNIIVRDRPASLMTKPIGLSGLVIRDTGLSLTVIFTLRGLGVADFIGLSGLVIRDAGLSLTVIFTLRGLGVAG
jgi:hypothetical protein